MKLRSSLPIASAATAAAIGIAGGATNAHAEELNLPGPIVCSGTGEMGSAKAVRLNMKIDSETLATKLQLDQLIGGWKDYNWPPAIKVNETRILTDGQGNFFSVFHYPGDKTGDRDEGYYFFALDLTTQSPDITSTPQIQLTKLTAGYGNEKGIKSPFKTKTPSGESGFSITKYPSLDMIRFIFKNSSTLQSIDTTPTGNILYEGNLVTNYTAEDDIIMKKIGGTGDATGFYVYKRTPQGFEETCKMVIDGATEVLDYTVNIKGTQYFGVTGTTKVTGSDGSAVFSNFITFIDPNNAKDESKYITTVGNVSYADVVDDEGRFLIQHTNGFAGSTKSSRKWFDLTTGDPATAKEKAFEFPTGSLGGAADSDRVSFVAKFTNQKGQITRVWAEVRQGKVIITYLVGEDIADMKQVVMDKSVVESNPNSSGTLDGFDYVCQTTKTYFPTVTPPPVDPGPEQEDGPDAKDSGNTEDMTKTEISTTEPDAIPDASSTDTAKPGDTGADATDAKIGGETITDTEAKDADTAGDVSPASDADATGTKDIPAQLDVVANDANKPDTQSEPNQGESAEEPDTTGADAGGTPIIDDTGKPADAVIQQPGGNGGGCSTANTAGEKTGVEAFAMAIAAGMLAAYSRSQNPTTKRKQIRDDIEAALR